LGLTGDSRVITVTKKTSDNLRKPHLKGGKNQILNSGETKNVHRRNDKRVHHPCRKKKARVMVWNEAMVILEV
jgi:hypothetical protein